MEHYAESVVEKTLSDKDLQIEGAKRAFNLAFDEYSKKHDGDLPDLTESTVDMFVKSRPEMGRALANLKLVNSNEWAGIALEVLKNKMIIIKD